MNNTVRSLRQFSISPASSVICKSYYVICTQPLFVVFVNVSTIPHTCTQPSHISGIAIAKITWLAKHLGIHAAEIESLKRYCTTEDFPLLVLLEWKKRQTVASRPHLASALLQSRFVKLAVKLDETGKSCMLMV